MGKVRILLTVMHPTITEYNQTQTGEPGRICQALADTIQAALAAAESKVWHGAPVWFINGNPIVGYAVRKHHVQLLFWSGRSFDEAGLQPEGTFQAAEARYTEVAQINPSDLKRWLKKAQTIQWDYKNIVKRKGVLERLI